MKSLCEHPSHTWTVETRSDILTTHLDLLLGRRCTCGLMVIVNDCLETQHGDMLQVVAIDSPQAAKFAHDNPVLKTW